MTTTLAFDVSWDARGTNINSECRAFSTGVGSLETGLPVTGTTTLVDFAEEAGWVQFVTDTANTTLRNLSNQIDSRVVGALWIQRLGARRYYRVIACKYHSSPNSQSSFTFAVERPVQSRSV